MFDTSTAAAQLVTRRLSRLADFDALFYEPSPLGEQGEGVEALIAAEQAEEPEIDDVEDPILLAHLRGAKVGSISGWRQAAGCLGTSQRRRGCSRGRYLPGSVSPFAVIMQALCSAFLIATSREVGAVVGVGISFSSAAACRLLSA